ncbi:TetR/AcrR family transcriptional regulator [Streptomyces niveus]|uniref:TetR/AcrR family transcriptional regulator n=1 Tax=Streptomyces niveus TaxID=193462 RepID=UPI0033A13388
MTGEEERGAARKAQIFEAAATVFARQGYHGARMDDIVKQSGLSKGALYWYFKSKEELATGLVDQILTAESQAMDTLMADPRPAAERLEEMVRNFAAELTRNPDKARLALELLALAHAIPDIRSCFSSHHEYYIARIGELLGEVQGSGTQDGGPQAHRTEAAALAVASVVDGLVLRWTLAQTPFDLEDRLWEAVDIIVRELRS